jgi:hypothetical protein
MLEEKGKSQRVISIIISAIFGILVGACIAVMAIAGLALCFCEHHSLMFLYWGPWTLIGIGSFIALWGITFHQWWAMTDHEHPPWNVALGTPVLVIAGMAHMGYTKIRHKWQNNSRNKQEDGTTGRYRT